MRYSLKDRFIEAVGRLIFFVKGWKFVGEMPPGTEKCVMIAAPHTSNWDIVYARSAFAIMHVPVRFTIKKEWMKTPMGFILKFLGALPIDRQPKGISKKKSMTQAMVDLFDERNELTILITPEGTRSLAVKWRTGFYHVAKEAGIPIVLGFLDYSTKTAGIGGAVIPTEDVEADMRKIMEFYAQKTPKFPEKFSVDKRYAPVKNS